MGTVDVGDDGIRRATDHGVDTRPWLDEVELPPNMAVLSSSDDSRPGC